MKETFVIFQTAEQHCFNNLISYALYYTLSPAACALSFSFIIDSRYADIALTFTAETRLSRYS